MRVLLVVVLLLLDNYVTSELCMDKHVDCHLWMEQGDCGKVEVKERCPRSCRRCHAKENDYIAEAISQGVDQTYRVVQGLIVVACLGVLVLFVKISNEGATCRSKGSLKGKVIVITGATSGVGYETAFRLALRGAQIVMGCPNLKRGLKMAKSLRDYTGQKLIEARKLDLSSLASVQEFAVDVNEDFSHVDILINNAAMIGGRKRELTKDGIEMTFQVNYLSHFLLTKMLISKLKQTSNSRIVNVVCDELSGAKLDLDDLQYSREFDRMQAYRNSKLALWLFTRNLSQVLKMRAITVNAVDPGRSFTQLWRRVFPFNYRIAQYAFEMYTYVFWRNSAQAAETMLYACVDKDLERVSGVCLKDCAPVAMKEFKEDSVQKLWEKSEELLRRIYEPATVAKVEHQNKTDEKDEEAVESVANNVEEQQKNNHDEEEEAVECLDNENKKDK